MKGNHHRGGAGVMKKKKKTHTKGVFLVNIVKSELYLRYWNC